MKSIKLFAASLAIAVLAACGGGNAQAAPLTEVFKADNGYVFNISEMKFVERVSGGVNVTPPSEAANFFQDASGTEWTKIQSIIGMNQHWVTIPGTNKILNTALISYVFCTGSMSSVRYPAHFGGTVENYDDACALYTAIKNAGN